MPVLLTAIPTVLAGVGATGAAATTSGWLASLGIGTAAAGTAGIGSTLATAATVLGTGMDVIGKISAGNAAADAAEANANIARMESKSITEAAKGETLKLSRQRRQLIGEQETIMAGAGIDTSSGSPLDVMANTAANFETDVQQLGYNAGVKSASKNYEASLYDWMAPQKRRAGWIGGISSAITGASAALRKNQGSIPLWE